MGVPKIRGTFLGGPHRKDVSIWGVASHWDFLVAFFAAHQKSVMISMTPLLAVETGTH